jgi:Transcriptional regulatory protein, C terminal
MRTALANATRHAQTASGRGEIRKPVRKYEIGPRQRSYQITEFGRLSRERTFAMFWLECAHQGHQRRFPVSSGMRIARVAGADIPLLDDPWASREPVVLTIIETGVEIDASRTTNGVIIRRRSSPFSRIKPGESFTVGSTEFRLAQAEAEAETLKVSAPSGDLVFQTSSRELFDAAGGLIARLSSMEARAFLPVVRARPDIATHRQIGAAVWGGEHAYDQYMVHRLMQRLRSRLGAVGPSLENVRGAGYRFDLPVLLT